MLINKKTALFKFLILLFLVLDLWAQDHHATLSGEATPPYTTPRSNNRIHKVSLGFIHTESAINYSGSPLPLGPDIYMGLNGVEASFDREFYFESLWSTASSLSLQLQQGREQAGDARLFHTGGKEAVHRTYHQEANFYALGPEQFFYYSFFNRQNFIIKPFLGLGLQQRIGQTVLNYAIQTQNQDVENFNSEGKISEIDGVGSLGLQLLNYHYGAFSFLKLNYHHFLTGTLNQTTEQFFPDGNVQALVRSKNKQAFDKNYLVYSIGIGLAFAKLGW